MKAFALSIYLEASSHKTFLLTPHTNAHRMHRAVEKKEKQNTRDNKTYLVLPQWEEV